MTLEEELLVALKKKAIKLGESVPEIKGISFNEKEETAKKKSYVLGKTLSESYLNNLYLNEEDFEQYKLSFEKGYGHELSQNERLGVNCKIVEGNAFNCKMQSLHSSSAMIVNILGRKKGEELRIKGNGYSIPEGEYDLSFEKQFRTLKTRNAFANVDAFLLSKDGATAVLIESKMFEYLDDKDDSYFDSASYFTKGDQFADVFGESLKAIGTVDYSQIIKHALGFYNARSNPKECFCNKNLNTEDLSKVKNVFILNVVWKMKEESFHLYPKYEPRWLAEKESAERLFPALEESLRKIICDPQDPNHIESLHIKFLSHDQLIDLVNDEDRLEYLKRYEL